MVEDMTKVKKFLKSQDLNFKNIELYENAFLHSSYTHETPWDDVSYDRLEFLGDSVLGKIVAEYLYKNFPEYGEGDMTLLKHHFVNKEYLAKVGRKLKLEELMFLGQGEKIEELSDSVFEDVFESLVGAIYLDLGHDVVSGWLDKLILSNISSVKPIDTKDSKTRLQEMLQSDKRKSVKYKTDEGKRKEDNTLIFTAQAIFEDTTIGEGSGTSKKEAEKDAAKDAIDRMAK